MIIQNNKLYYDYLFLKIYLYRILLILLQNDWAHFQHNFSAEI